MSNKGVHLFFDWIEEMQDLQDPEFAWSVVLALRDYALHGIDPTLGFSGVHKAFVRNMFNQIQRAELRAEINRENAKKRYEGAENRSAIAVQNAATAEQSLTTITNTVTNTITSTNTDTNTTTTTVPTFNESATMDRVRFRLAVIKLFQQRGYVSSALGFLAYNDARDWRGIGGENVKEHLERYAAEWERREQMKVR